MNDVVADMTPADSRYLDRRLAVVPSGSRPDTFVGAGADYGPLRIQGGHLPGQGDGLLATMTASFKVPEPGDVHQPPTPEVPPPDGEPLSLPFTGVAGVTLVPVSDWQPRAPAGGEPWNWMLFAQHGPAAGDSRGLNQGRIFTRDGSLVTSVAQEAMMRRL